MPPLLPAFLRPLLALKNSYTTRYAGHPVRVLSACVKIGLFCHVFAEYGFALTQTYGASMLPTFEVIGDWVIISKSYRRGRGVVVGDVVSFDSVVEPGEAVIKRVVGLEGDYVLRDTPGSGNDAMLQVSS